MRFVSILFTGQQLLLSSNGPAKQFRADCLGVYIKDGGISNGKPTYKDEMNARVIHWMPRLGWLVSAIFKA